MPLAAHATLNQGVLSITAAWGDPDNSHAALIQAKDQCTLDLSSPNALAQASQLGVTVAKQLIKNGAVALVK
jgi:hypothetical protein